MTPNELSRALDSLVSEESAQRAMESGAREAIKDVRVRGHRIAMSGPRIRVSGPSAPMVAKKISVEAGKGAQRSLREMLS